MSFAVDLARMSVVCTRTYLAGMIILLVLMLFKKKWEIRQM